MSLPDTAEDGLPARSVFHAIAMPPRRRRSAAERLRKAVRHHAGMGVFLMMLVVSVTLVVFSR
ncbi:MAG: hypothetical protein JO055_07485 [Alphaproteobacteria bacterium]|nr:hypothetical protein [Alphaproteobacteria bacterium]